MLELMKLLGFSLLGIGAGVSFVVQQALNADLRGCLGSASWAAFISYFGGVITMLVVLLVMREPWLSPAAVTTSSWWLWTGGFFGAIYIVVAVVLLPRLGAATVVALIVTGQMLSSLAFDQFGLLGIIQHPVSILRLAGSAARRRCYPDSILNAESAFRTVDLCRCAQRRKPCRNIRIKSPVRALRPGIFSSDLTMP